MENKTTEQASKVLGKQSGYPTSYDPSVLVGVDRTENRVAIGIDPHHLRFFGYDIWNIYEISFLLDNGLPVTFIGKLQYACDSPNIVESKSLKLYFYSMNQERMGKTVNRAVDNFRTRVVNDIEKVVGQRVNFYLFTEEIHAYDDFSHYISLDNYDALSRYEFDHYTESPHLIKVSDTQGSGYYHTSLLRSNCRVTHQPDWGDLYVYYMAEKRIKINSLVQYIVSFRNENHFHEEVVETIFKRLQDALGPKCELGVTGKYTRRGGIDINPSRYTSLKMRPRSLVDPSRRVKKTLRQ